MLNCWTGNENIYGRWKFMDKENDITLHHFVQYALKHYRYGKHTIAFEEFIRDYKSPMLLNKFFYKYNNTGVTNHMRIINIIITYFNVFDEDAAFKMLFIFIKPEYKTFLKTYIEFIVSTKKVFLMKPHTVYDKIDIDPQLKTKIIILHQNLPAFD